MKSTAFVTVALLAAAVFDAHAQHALDLTKLPPRTPSSPPGFDRIVLPPRGRGPTAPTAGERPTNLPLHVAVVGLDRADYIIGSRIIYVVAIRNTGSTDFVFPWTPPDPDKVPRDESITARIGLMVGDKEGRDHFFHSTVLTGDPDLPGTLRTLRPGETATIRVPASLEIDPDEAEAAFTVDGSQLPVRVIFQFETSDRSWQFIKSDGLLANIRLPPPERKKK